MLTSSENVLVAPPTSSFRGLLADPVDDSSKRMADGAVVHAESFLGGSKESTDITFTNLTLTLRPKKKGQSPKLILDNLSGTVHSGKLTALMGPSGSGKTSLLNALAGRTKQMKGLALTGSITANRKSVTSWSEYRRKCAYVEQDDLLFHTLTVRETIQLAADLRLPRTMTKAERDDRVTRTIAELGLRKCENTRIGNARMRGVSGGERKRVSIAIEILRGPSVLFLDECTTGLDSFQALRVATTIKELALGGRTIVSSIHQPRSSIFALFDDVALLSEGKMMYYGPAAEIVAYFEGLGYPMPENFNPADFALDLVSIDQRTEEVEQETKQRLQDLAAKYVSTNGKVENPQSDVPVTESSSSNNSNSETSTSVPIVAADDEEDDELKFKYQTPRSKQFGLLCQRAARQKIRDRTAILIPLFSTIFFAVLLGCLYFQSGKNLSQQAIQDKTGCLFFLSLNQFMSGMFGMLSVFPTEKFIINRERSAKTYALSPFYIAKVMADFPMIVFPWMFCTIVYFLVLFKQDAAAYFETAVTCILAYLTAASMGMFVGALAPSQIVAQGMAMPFMLIFILFSGFYANNSLIPAALNWIQWISPIRWIFASMMTIQFSGIKFDCNTGPLNCIPDGDAYLRRLGLQDDSFGRSLGVLLGLMSFYHLAAYTVLRVRRAKWVIPKQGLKME